MNERADKGAYAELWGTDPCFGTGYIYMQTHKTANQVQDIVFELVNWCQVDPASNYDEMM